MFKNKALSCMLALGLTVAAAPAVLAGPNDTAGNTGVVDKTENPEDAPTQPPGEESSGATSTEGTSTEGTTPEGSTEGTTDGTTSTEGTTPEGEGTTTTPEGETPTEGSTSTEGATTPEGTTSTEGTTTPESTTEGTTSSGSSLPQTGAPVVLLAPVLAAGGVAGYSLYKKSH